LWSEITTGSITIGSGLTTGTINIDTASTDSHTINIATGATVASKTKTVNIGTSGLASSITNINIGAISGGGTTTIYGSTAVKIPKLNSAGAVYTAGTDGSLSVGILSSSYGGTGINNGGRTLTINTNSGTLSFTNAGTTLTIANTASVSGTNTGDQTNITGNAGSANKVNSAITFNSSGSGATSETTFDGSAAKTISYNTIGAAAASHGTHVDYSATNPLVNGTASAGSSANVSRGDHVHPTDTTRAAVGQTMYIGTTGVAINRSSAALTLEGITLTDGTLNNIKASSSTTAADLWSEITTGSITIGSGLTTSGAVNIGNNTDATAINLKAGTGGVVITNPHFIAMPAGTDAQRPGSPAAGYFRFNTTSNTFEGYANSTWGATEINNNKKSTLAENSEIYYPNQKAVNDGLNLTMAETMGFAPRNLMDVFGTATVAETFQALRTYCNQNGSYNTHLDGFRKLRLGDYIDLPSLTMSADSVNPLVYPARTINNDYNRLRVEIVGFDDYYQVGNTAVPSQHHVTMMFKDIPTTAKFNNTNTTTGDYPGSMLFHWLHEQFESALISAINGGGATVVEPLAVDRFIGTVANWGFVGSEKIFLPTSVNIFGTTGFSHTNYGTGTQTQFALFALNPNRKIKRNNDSRSTWWLAEPMANSSTCFCSANAQGHSRYDFAGGTFGVVPAFLI
jgi:hypothetical protein